MKLETQHDERWKGAQRHRSMVAAAGHWIGSGHQLEAQVPARRGQPAALLLAPTCRPWRTKPGHAVRAAGVNVVVGTDDVRVADQLRDQNGGIVVGGRAPAVGINCVYNSIDLGRFITTNSNLQQATTQVDETAMAGGAPSWALSEKFSGEPPTAEALFPSPKLLIAYRWGDTHQLENCAGSAKPAGIAIVIFTRSPCERNLD